MMKKTIAYLLLVMTASFGCSREALMKMITKTPKLDTYHERDLSTYNDYQRDIDYLRAFIQAAYPRLDTKTPAAALDSICQSLIDRSVGITDEQFDLYLRKIMSVLQDVHSCYSVDFGKYDRAFFFLYLKYQDDHWYIHTIDTNVAKRALGSRLIALNGIPAEELDQLIRDNICGETPDFKRWKFVTRQRFPTFLAETRIAHDKEKLTVQYQHDGVNYTDTLFARPAGKYHPLAYERYDPDYLHQQNNGFFYKIDSAGNLGYLQMNTSLDYVSIKADLHNYTSFIIRPLAMAYLKKQTKDARDFGRTVAAFFREIQGQQIDNVVLDLRNNRGGDERPGKQFLWYLEAAHRREPKGFTDYLKYSEYVEQMVKKEARRIAKLYKAKHGEPPRPGTEINVSQLSADSSFFDDILRSEGDFYLDPTIKKFNGNLYVLTSEHTNSAAQVLATTIVDNKLGKVMGVPPGNTPSTQTGTLMFKLPNTKRILSLSYYYMERPDKKRNAEKELQLDQVIYQRYEDRLQGKQTLFEQILSEIKER